MRPETPSEGAREAKRALRERMRQVRAGLPLAARAEASAAITEILCASPVWRAARCVALYASLPEEVDTAPLIAAARAEGRRVALPAVVGRGAPLEFRDATDPRAPMSASRFGVLEPAPGAAVVPLDAIDLFVVPALAFDRDRRRLGYGAGFYDRTLSGLAAHKVLVAFAAQEVPHMPSDAHDVAMDAVLTERGFVAP